MFAIDEGEVFAIKIANKTYLGQFFFFKKKRTTNQNYYRSNKKKDLVGKWAEDLSIS